MDTNLYRIVDDSEHRIVATGMTYSQAAETISFYRADYPENKFTIESYTPRFEHDPDLYND